jgi:hypothetical protein
MASVRADQEIFSFGRWRLGLWTPFVRMLILSRLLGLDELGFSSALAAIDAAFEQVAEIVISRFVFSSQHVNGP